MKYNNLAVYAAAVVSTVMLATTVHAADIPTGDSGITLRIDTTAGYAVGFRTEEPSAALSAGPGAINFNDGDLNFADRGRPITDRIDLLTEADLTFRDFGARVSAAGWYDQAYHDATSNDARLAFPPPGPFSSAATLNSGSPGHFATSTRDLQGQKAEFLDAFVFGKVVVADLPLNVRLGQYALLWGESLFFGANAIAGGMAPLDIIKAQSSPNATIKEIIRPVPQASAELQLTPTLSVGAFYQFKWQKSRLPAAGSYYSANDTIDVAGDRLYLPTPVVTPAGAFDIYVPALRGADQSAPNSGQFGMQTHFRVPGLQADFGLYAIQFHDKLPVAYLDFASLPLPTYRLVYPEDIRAFGASFNTTLGDVNLGGEASIRTNSPLARGFVALTGGPGPYDAHDNPAYAVGHTAQANLSTLYSVPPMFWARESNLAAEVAWNRVLRCQLNCVDIPPSAENPFGFTPRDGNAQRDAWGWRMVYTPIYRQAISGIDLSVPVGWSYSPKGKSEALGPIFVNHGGDCSVGLSANVRETYSVALNFTHYYGAALVQADANSFFTFGQSLRDRDNVTLSARYSF